MKKLENLMRKIVAVPAIIAGVSLIVLMLVTVVDVFMRLLINKTVVGSNEISVAVMIVAGFLGIAWCGLNDSHIKVDLLVGIFPEKVQKQFFRINYLIVAAVSILICTQSYKQVTKVIRLNQQSDLLGIPVYPFYLVVSFSYLLLFITALAMFVMSFGKKGEEPVKGLASQE